jgi:hypothetical protein
LQKFAETHPKQTGTEFYCFGEALRATVAAQATPHLYRKFTDGPILTHLGSGISLSDFVSGIPVLAGVSRTGQALRELLFQTAGAEEEYQDRNWDYDSMDELGFPFYDLWPWPEHKDSAEAVVSNLSQIRFVRD